MDPVVQQDSQSTIQQDLKNQNQRQNPNGDDKSQQLAAPKKSRRYAMAAIMILIIAVIIYLGYHYGSKTLYPTTISIGASGNVAATTSITTINQTTTIVQSKTLESCKNFTVAIAINKTSASAACAWAGGNITLSFITSPNSTLGYVIQSFNSTNTTYESSFVQYSGICAKALAPKFLSKGNYLVQIHVYGQANSMQCGQPSLKLS